MRQEKPTEATMTEGEARTALEEILKHLCAVRDLAARVKSEILMPSPLVLREMYDDALRRLREHRALLDRIAAALLERETLDGGELALLMAV